MMSTPTAMPTAMTTMPSASRMPRAWIVNRQP